MVFNIVSQKLFILFLKLCLETKKDFFGVMLQTNEK